MSPDPKILLVDHDEAAREALRAAMAQLGYQVDLAASVQQARERIARAEYAVAFADLRLPDGSGLELIAAEEADLSAPLVIVTAERASLQSSLQAINLGARGFITRPYHVDEVKARTEAAVKEFESREHHRRALEHARERADFYQRLAMVDNLTGLFNDRYFRLALRREIHAARRYGRPLSLLLIDVDHFKRFNDAFGHAAGDHCLRHVATVIQDAARDVDIVARWGGEEFAAILPQTGPKGAARCARRIREAVALSPPAPVDGRALPGVTVSVGFASFPNAVDDPDSLFHGADTALYQAKRAGRNCVMGPLPEAHVRPEAPTSTVPVG